MLDEKNEAVLNRILTECNGKYKIFACEDFFEIDNLEDSINFLSESGYIVLRYNNQGEYLIIPTQKGHAYFKQKSQKLLRDAVFSEVLRKSSFKGAFLGAFLAVFCIGTACLLTFIIKVFYAF